MTISLCMIVRNEQEVLARCLESVQGVADEIIIGQMDGYTKEWNINGEKVTLGVKKL